jgi:NAD(P)-dependent dehydrogenase (short-subunit alcohol dehydrogenase family)
MNEPKIFSLEGKVAFVTGASGNIGKMAGRAYALHGAKVVLVDIDLPGVEEVADEIRQAGAEAIALKMDVTDPAGVESVVKNVIDKYGRIDVLFNNVGINHRHPAEEVPLDVWENVLRINLTGEFIVAQAVAKTAMIPQQAGSIINTSSVSGGLGHPGQIAYAAAKHGVIGMTKVFAIEWAKYQIRVNAIGPGVLATPMKIGTDYVGATREKLAEKIPLGRLAQPEDLMGTLVYLASDASSYVTGQTIFVEGGRMID